MKKDIEDRDDVILLVDTFYNSVRTNKILDYIFNDVAQINWKEHLPRMYSFWASILLGEHSFLGNPMQKHIALSKMTPLTEIEFKEWLLLFTTTVDELFEGKNADEAKLRAGKIASLILHKINTI